MAFIQQYEALDYNTGLRTWKGRMVGGQGHSPPSADYSCATYSLMFARENEADSDSVIIPYLR